MGSTTAMRKMRTSLNSITNGGGGLGGAGPWTFAANGARHQGFVGLADRNDTKDINRGEDDLMDDVLEADDNGRSGGEAVKPKAGGISPQLDNNEDHFLSILVFLGLGFPSSSLEFYYHFFDFSTPNQSAFLVLFTYLASVMEEGLAEACAQLRLTEDEQTAITLEDVIDDNA
ncbi:uncharacterized protein LOC126661934 [Mercurialis annua]|uniref:uncharacterized protein LOC126661934 n=1 Tax=Mercurialis annua TaxID=3986 RepID=UPI002160871C|nr:uncharacterized protein LOC126661934 [Mercurialis annua]